MNVLEKILEEISEVEKEHVTGHKVLYALGATSMATEISSIIRSHMDEINTLKKKPVWEMDVMHHESYDLGRNVGWNECLEAMQQNTNDGWIPVEERLPNKREFQEAYCRNEYAAEFLVTIEGATRPTTLYFKNNSWFDEERNYYKVIAWQPLPEAYHPKQAPAAEHIMSRFTRVE